MENTLSVANSYWMIEWRTPCTVCTFRAGLAGGLSQLILVEAGVAARGGGRVGQAVVALRAQVRVRVGHRLARWAVVA